MRCLSFLLLLLATLCFPAHALMLQATAGLRDSVNLGGHLAVRCVANTDESIADVAAPEHEDEFAAIPGLLLSGFTRDTCWLRFSLQRTADAPRDWLLEVGAPFLDDVTLYLQKSSINITPRFESLRLGDHLPFSDRPVPFRQFAFPVHLEDEKPATAYLRVQTSSTMVVETLNLWQPSGLLSHAQTDSAMYWSVFGLITLGLFSNLLFWAWLREPVYLIYSLYLLGLLFTNLVNSGYLAQIVLTDAPILADRLLGVLVAITYGLGLLFFRNILDLRQSFPRADRLVPAVLAFYLMCAASSAMGYHHVLAFWLQLVGLIVTFSIMVAGPWLIWRGRRELLLYIFAFSIQFVILIAVTLRNLGLWPLELPLNYFIMLTTGIHVVLLNIALAERMRQTHRQQTLLAKEMAKLDAQRKVIDEQKEFVSMVAHEFRTPMAIIDTSAQRIAGNPKAEAHLTIERCRNIREGVQRMTSMIEEFLTFDRMESDRLNYASENCSLSEIIDRLMSEFQDARLKVDTMHAPASVHADVALITIALGNLVSNALRYSPVDKPVQLIVSATNTGEVAFTVEDEGPGISAEEVSKIFQKYTRGGAGASKPGAGLGLNIADRIVKLHGGWIKVDNRQNGGARFTLFLP
jgi:signal transduction histidine kinase